MSELQTVPVIDEWLLSVQTTNDDYVNMVSKGDNIECRWMIALEVVGCIYTKLWEHSSPPE